MNFIEAVRSGKPFRRPKWVEPEDEIQWCILAPNNIRFSECQILWEEDSVFGDITHEILYADDFEIKKD